MTCVSGYSLRSLFFHLFTQEEKRKMRFTWIHGCWFFSFYSVLLPFSFHSLILFWKCFVFVACLCSEISSRKWRTPRLFTSMERKGYNFFGTPQSISCFEHQSIDLSLFLIGGCRQTVSSCFLFPCNLILSTEVTVLISINPKNLSVTHFPCAIFSCVQRSLKPTRTSFTTTVWYYVCLVFQ